MQRRNYKVLHQNDSLQIRQTEVRETSSIGGQVLVYLQDDLPIDYAALTEQTPLCERHQ